MQFSDLPGHEKIVRKWYAQIKNNRLPHATLLLGSEGAGKLALTLALVKRMFCNNSEELDPCDTCTNCNKIEKLIHSNLIFSYPTVSSSSGSATTADDYALEWAKAVVENPFLSLREWMDTIKAKTKRGNISVKEINRISQRLHLHSYEEGPKVLIVWKADYLAKAGNKLLKLIEEPPSDTYIFLLAEDEENILLTIKSRCQTINVGRLSESKMKAYLEKNTDASEKQIIESVRLAEGSMSEALNYLKNGGDTYEELLFPWLRNCYKGNAAGILKNSEHFAKMNKHQQQNFFLKSLQLLRQIPYFQLGMEDKVLALKEEYSSLGKLSKILSGMQISGMQEIIDQSAFSLRRNANVKLLFMTASIRLHEVFCQ